MRLTLVIASVGSGGAERVMSLMANHWAAKSWSVTLITLSGTDTDFYPLDARVQRVGLDMMGHSRGIWDRLWYSAKRVRVLRQAIGASRPQVVISFIEQMNILVLLAGVGQSWPVVVSERTDPRQYAVGRLTNILRRWLYPRAAAVVVQTPSVAQWALMFLPPAKVRVVANPLSPLEVVNAAPAVTWLKPQKKHLLAVGQLYPVKGFDLLLKAFAYVAPRHPQWNLVILGEGSERHTLTQLAQDLGIETRVIFPGKVSPIAAYYPLFDGFVLSSRFEGFPNALLEAMSHGLPVVSFACDSGPADIITHGQDGLLVPPQDISAMGQALDTLMGDAALRQRLGEQAAQVNTRYALSVIMAQWEALLAQVTQENK